MIKQLNEGLVLLYKKIGETPLEALSRLRTEYPKYEKAVLSYAGRLDPMAEGLLLVLVNDENKKRAQYLNLDKEYEIEILCGIETDTYDILGKIKKTRKNVQIDEDKIHNTLKSFEKTFDQLYPPYSSKAVNGKPLFQWAREGKLDQITIPTKKVTIKNIEILNKRVVTAEELQKQIISKIEDISGDFRQKDILQCWGTFLEKKHKKRFTVVKIRVNCTSGTYMRSLAQSIGGVTLSIARTKIGNYGLK